MIVEQTYRGTSTTVRHARDHYLPMVPVVPVFSQRPDSEILRHHREQMRLGECDYAHAAGKLATSNSTVRCLWPDDFVVILRAPPSPRTWDRSFLVAHNG
jgi:hypothetical protein